MKKLIFAIVLSDAVEPVCNALVGAQFSVTQVSSMGGFLRRGSTTLMIGTDSDQVENALGLIRQHCAPFSKGSEHAATIFVIAANDFIQI